MVAVLRPAARSLVLPALPLLGAAYLVVMLHLTGLFLPVSIGAWIAVGVAVVGLLVGLRTHRRRRRAAGRNAVTGAGAPGAVTPPGADGNLTRTAWIARRDALAWLGALVVGVPGAVLAWLPSLLARSPLAIQATANNDAFYYASVVDWVKNHAITMQPFIAGSPAEGSDAPGYGPALESLELGLRVGQELVQAGLSTLTGLPTAATFSPWLALWVLVLPGGVWVLGRVFGLHLMGRVVLGLAIATSFSLVNQVLNQNADSLLGIALLPLVIALVVAAVRPGADGRAAPIWLASLVLGGIVGTYTEFLPFLGIVLALIVLIRPLRQLGPVLIRALVVIVVSVVIAPLVWIRAAQNLLTVSSVAGSTAGTKTSIGVALRGLLGPLQPIWFPADAPPPGVTLQVQIAVVAFAVVAGCVFALIAGRSRGLAIGTAIGSLLVVYIGYNGNAYSADRAAALVTPLLLISATLGWSSFVGWLSARGLPNADRPAQPVRRAARITALVVVAALTLVTLRVGVLNGLESTVSKRADDRVLTNDFAQAAGWVDEVAGEDGSDVAVATGDLYQQLWLSEALSPLPDVSYISLRGDLGYRANLSMHSFWNRTPERYLLVGKGSYGAYAAGAVVHQNTSFALVDMTKGAAIAVPVVVSTPNWLYVTNPDGSLTSIGDGAVQLLSTGGRQEGSALDIEGVTAGGTVVLSQNGVQLARATAVAGSSTIELPLGDVTFADDLALVSVSIENAAAGQGFSLAGITSGATGG